MSTLYLHIGASKTGSSAIQSFLTLNSELLKSKNYYYPFPQFFFQNFQTSSGNASFLLNVFSDNSISKEQKDERMFELKKSTYDIILSCETLFFEEEEAFKYISNFFETIKVIVYLRRQDNWIESSNIQAIKNHNYTKISSQCMDEKYAFYYSRLEMLASICGKDNIIVRPYESIQLVNKDIVEDFLSIFDLCLSDEFILPDKIVNPSLNREYTELKRICNNLPISEEDLRELFLDSFWSLSVNESGGAPFSMLNLYSPKERYDIIQKYEIDNEKIAREYLGREDGKLFYDPLPDINEPWQSYAGLSIETVIKGFGALLYRQQEIIKKQSFIIDNYENRISSLEKAIHN